MSAVQVYEPKNLKRIAVAVRVPPSKLRPFVERLEVAAMWYRLGTKPIQRVSPSQLRTRLGQVSSHAKKLMSAIGISDPNAALDGPGDYAVLNALTSSRGPTEDEVLMAADRIARLLEICSSIQAASDFHRWADEAKQASVKVQRKVTMQGHVGDLAVNDWIAGIMPIYKELTGKKPATSTAKITRPNEGEATGPLIRFLGAASEPMGLQLTPNAWRARVRTILKHHTAQK